MLFSFLSSPKYIIYYFIQNIKYFLHYFTLFDTLVIDINKNIYYHIQLDNDKGGNKWLQKKEVENVNYIDITKNFAKNNKSNSHKILDKNYFKDSKGFKYKVDGKNVVLDYSKKKKEKDIAIWLEKNIWRKNIYASKNK